DDDSQLHWKSPVGSRGKTVCDPIRRQTSSALTPGCDCTSTYESWVRSCPTNFTASLQGVEMTGWLKNGAKEPEMPPSLTLWSFISSSRSSSNGSSGKSRMYPALSIT